LAVVALLIHQVLTLYFLLSLLQAAVAVDFIQLVQVHQVVQAEAVLELVQV
jgi:hypothetical protein